MMKTTIKLASVLLVSAFVFFACSKDENGEPAKITQLPEVGDLEISAITTASFRYKASVVNEGSSEITEKGICYGTSENPTTANSKTTDGKGKAIFTGSVEKLTAEKTYFVRAYATNSEGTGYGEQAKVTLLALKKLVRAEIGKPSEKGEVVTVKFNGKEIQAIKKGDKYFIEGDIFIEKEFNTKGTALDYEPRRWKNNTFVFKIDPNFPKKERIYDAFKFFQETNIRFKEHTDEKNYVLFQYIKDDGCWSRLGMRNKGEQEIVIDNWGEAGNVAHEICHALGLWHEQMRPDRDEYIKVEFDNITEDWKGQYKARENKPWVYTSATFDFGSIMLYDSWGCCGVAIDESKPIMTKLDGKTFDSQREKLSATDIETLNRLYPKLADLEVFKTEIALEVGESAKVEITAGTGEYEVKSKNTDIATASLSKNMITISALKEGVTQIVVTDKNTEQSQEIKVTISPKMPDLAIGEQKTNSLEIGQTATLLTITAGSGSYTVTSSDTKKATVTEKDGVITVTAKGEGEVTVTIKDNKTGQTKTVKVTISPKTPDLAIGEQKIKNLEVGQTATLLTITAGSGNYTVTSSDTKKATVSEKDGAVTITAVGEGEVTISIKDNKTGQIKTVKITINPKTPDLAIGEQKINKLEVGQTATLLTITAGSGNYMVTSSDTKKATVTEKDGVVSITAKGEGEVTITIKDNKTGQTKTVKVSVSPKTPDLAIDKTQVSFSLGIEPFEEKVTIIAGSGNYTATSSNDKIAKASLENNVVTISLGDDTNSITGSAEAIITVTDTKTGQTKEIQVQVMAPLELMLEKTEVSLKVGEQETVRISTHTGKCETASANENVATATLDESGMESINITAKAVGETTITVTDTGTGSTVDIKVTVTEQPADTSTYIELTTTKAVGETIKLAMKADEQDKADIWIDLNNNGTRDEGEKVTKFNEGYYYPKEAFGTYKLKNQTIRVYGKVKEFCIYPKWNREEGRYLGQNLTKLDVSHNTQLIHLECRGNQLSSLDVSQNTQLTGLYCGSNQLSSLDVSQNTQLTDLYCDGNQLSSLDVSQNTQLTELVCTENQLSSLDVSQNTQLTGLHCGGNQLSSLDVSQNTQLTELVCPVNQLSSLDISQNIELQNLHCFGNQLSSLDVSYCPKLGIGKNRFGNIHAFHCTYNKNLTCIKVSQEQLDSLKDRNWYKDDTATYNTNCN